MRVLVLTPYPYGTAPGPRSSFELWERVLAPAGIELRYAVFESERLQDIIYRPGETAAKALEMARCYRRLIGKLVEFYREALFNPHWGEQINIGRGFVQIAMVFQGLDKQQAEAVWRPFFDWVAAAPQDFTVISGARIGALPKSKSGQKSLRPN